MYSQYVQSLQESDKRFLHQLRIAYEGREQEFLYIVEQLKIINFDEINPDQLIYEVKQFRNSQIYSSNSDSRKCSPTYTNQFAYNSPSHIRSVKHYEDGEIHNLFSAYNSPEAVQRAQYQPYQNVDLPIPTANDILVSLIGESNILVTRDGQLVQGVDEDGNPKIDSNYQRYESQLHSQKQKPTRSSYVDQKRQVVSPKPGNRLKDSRTSTARSLLVNEQNLSRSSTRVRMDLDQ